MYISKICVSRLLFLLWMKLCVDQFLNDYLGLLIFTNVKNLLKSKNFNEFLNRKSRILKLWKATASDQPKANIAMMHTAGRQDRSFWTTLVEAGHDDDDDDDDDR